MKFILMLFICCLLSSFVFSQWTKINALAPHASGGGMLLLSDGSVLVKSSSGSDIYGNLYDKLTPNINGSYVNGTWSSIAPMANTRLYYSSQVLKDGRVYVAGGEYGTGQSSGEVYDPLTGFWTNTPNLGTYTGDANSEILDNGTVLQALVGSPQGEGTLLYSPNTNGYVAGPTCLGNNDESAWIKLPDNSILYVNLSSRSCERFIPATNTWIADAIVPVDLYDPYGQEAGGAVLLPDSRALFLGSTGHNAYYTPSGTTANGIWTIAPDFPNAQGTPDAPACLLINGMVLCDASPIPTAANNFPKPTTFYLFDPSTNIFTSIAAPGGGANLNISSYVTTFLALPDGNVLYSQQGSNQYYVYTPVGSPQDSWKPTINSITQTGTNTYRLTGTQFNGISQGATYGDDWQMRTNYPLVRLVDGTNVYYARTSSWNSTGVKRGNSADTVTFTLPTGIPSATYSLYIVTNGIASSSIQFSLTCASNITISGSYSTPITQSSTWINSSGQTTILNTANVKLDANPNTGYVELKPVSSTDYFISAPNTNTAVFVAQALDGCGGVVPNRLSVSKPTITTNKLLNVPPIPPLHNSLAVHPDSILDNNILQVFPNPANKSFIVKSNNNMENAKLQLFNVDGKTENIYIKNIDRFNKKISWNYLSSGIYILKINLNKANTFIKVRIK